jgi:hypothetical protein
MNVTSTERSETCRELKLLRSPFLASSSPPFFRYILLDSISKKIYVEPSRLAYE